MREIVRDIWMTSVLQVQTCLNLSLLILKATNSANLISTLVPIDDSSETAGTFLLVAKKKHTLFSLGGRTLSWGTSRIDKTGSNKNGIEFDHLLRPSSNLPFHEAVLNFTRRNIAENVLQNVLESVQKVLWGICTYRSGCGILWRLREEFNLIEPYEHKFISITVSYLNIQVCHYHDIQNHGTEDIWRNAEHQQLLILDKPENCSLKRLRL